MTTMVRACPTEQNSVLDKELPWTINGGVLWFLSVKTVERGSVKQLGRTPLNWLARVTGNPAKLTWQRPCPETRHVKKLWIHCDRLHTVWWRVAVVCYTRTNLHWSWRAFHARRWLRSFSCPATGSRRPRARERVVVAAAVDDAEVGVHPSGQAVMLLWPPLSAMCVCVRVCVLLCGQRDESR